MGNCGVPFMNTTTSLPLTSLSMNCSMPMIRSSWGPRPVRRLCSARPAESQDPTGTLLGSHFLRKTGVHFSGKCSKSRLRHAGLQRQRVQGPTHLPLEGLVDQLVLLHPRLAAKRLGDHGGGVMVAVAGEIADGHRGVRDAGLDQALD